MNIYDLEDDSLIYRSGMWSTFVSPVRAKQQARGHMSTSAWTQGQWCCVGSLHIYLLVILSKLETYVMTIVTRESGC